MTEDEAKMKWCPQTRVNGASHSYNVEWHTNRPSVADVDVENFDRCAGSACMAWRWVTEQVFNDAFGEVTKTKTSQGYCGLAGSPNA